MAEQIARKMRIASGTQGSAGPHSSWHNRRQIPTGIQHRLSFP